MPWRRAWATARESGAPAREETHPLRATIRVATQLRQDELIALRSVLERHFNSPLDIAVEIDPSTLGGVWVRVGDTVIDGSVQGRLEALRRHLRMQCQIMVRNDDGMSGSEAQTP